MIAPGTHPPRHGQPVMGEARHAPRDLIDSRFGRHGFSGTGRGPFVCGGRPPISTTNGIAWAGWSRLPGRCGVTPRQSEAAASPSSRSRMGRWAGRNAAARAPPGRKAHPATGVAYCEMTAAISSSNA